MDNYTYIALWMVIWVGTVCVAVTIPISWDRRNKGRKIKNVRWKM